MSKYQKLALHLANLDKTKWTADFVEIEALLGFSLPKSAHNYAAWWSNQAGDGHSQNEAWKSRGWRTGDLNLANKKVTFFRENFGSDSEVITSDFSPERQVEPLTIAQAKAGLAAFLKVPLENIEITIRG